MTSYSLPPNPEFGEELEPCHPNGETLALLARRRTTSANTMTGPGPDAAQLDDLLRLATRVPDHGKLGPWRFIVFEGDARKKLGKVMRASFAEANPDATGELLDFEERRPTRAPTLIAVISRVKEKYKIPEWEQILSAGAVCQTLLIAANAMGFAAQWITEWYAYDQNVKDALGLKSGERIAGFVYIGTATEPPRERVRPDFHSRVTRFEG